MDARVPFTSPRFFGDPSLAVEDAITRGGGGGHALYASRCEAWLRERVGSVAALLTPSCTAALELAALTLGLGPGDEVVLPSFAFPSLAAAVALRGATPVFVDVRRDTLGLDPALVEAAVTPRTRAIFLLAYGGVAGDVEAIGAIAARHGLATVEDNAHGLCATHAGRPLGSFGDLAALSFHSTKNVQIGEGGALLINRERYVNHAQTLQDKGTNRRAFLRGHVARYEWVEVGSSPLVGEVPAALLWTQLLYADEITAQRRAICDAYREAFAGLADLGLIELPQAPPDDAPDAPRRPPGRPRFLLPAQLPGGAGAADRGAARGRGGGDVPLRPAAFQ